MGIKRDEGANSTQQTVTYIVIQTQRKGVDSLLLRARTPPLHPVQPSRIRAPFAALRPNRRVISPFPAQTPGAASSRPG